MKTGLLIRKFSTPAKVDFQLIFLFSMIAVLFLMASCRRDKRPGSSDQELITQQEIEDTLMEKADTLIETADTLQQKALMDFGTETYVIPPGIKYTESREVDAG